MNETLAIHEMELEKDIDAKTSKFQRDDADDLVHNLHLALLQVATIDYLHFNLQALEAEYRQAAGPTAYEAYLTASMPWKETSMYQRWCETPDRARRERITSQGKKAIG